jgi:hypothetical protein
MHGDPKSADRVLSHIFYYIQVSFKKRIKQSQKVLSNHYVSTLKVHHHMPYESYFMKFSCRHNHNSYKCIYGNKYIFKILFRCFPRKCEGHHASFLIKKHKCNLNIIYCNLFLLDTMFTYIMYQYMSVRACPHVHVRVLIG